jgi:hypothetical protein
MSRPDRVFGDTVRQHPKLAEARMQLALTLAGEHKYSLAAQTLSLVTAPMSAADRGDYRLAASIHSGLGQKQAAARDMEKALYRRRRVGSYTCSPLSPRRTRPTGRTALAI